MAWWNSISVRTVSAASNTDKRCTHSFQGFHHLGVLLLACVQQWLQDRKKSRTKVFCLWSFCLQARKVLMRFLGVCHHAGLQVAEASWRAAFLVNLLHLLKDHSQPVCWLNSLRPLAIKIHDVMKQAPQRWLAMPETRKTWRPSCLTILVVSPGMLNKTYLLPRLLHCQGTQSSGPPPSKSCRLSFWSLAAVHRRTSSKTETSSVEALRCLQTSHGLLAGSRPLPRCQCLQGVVEGVNHRMQSILHSF